MSDHPQSRGESEPLPVEITWDGLDQPEVVSRVEEMKRARPVPLVRAVGEAPETPSGVRAILRGSLVSMTLAGLLGGLVAFGLVESIAQPDSGDPWYGDGDHTGNILSSLLIGLGIGLVISGWEGLQARSATKAARLMGLAGLALVLLGLIGGYIASLIFQEMMEGVIEEAADRAMSQDDFSGQEDAFLDYVSNHMHLPRGIGIGIVGLTVGAALGLASLSLRRAVNGAIEGVIGGFLGGFLFDFIAADSGWVPRLVAITLIGVLIGGLTGLIEVARRDHWLEIVRGGMAGKQFIVYNRETMVGAAADTAVTLIKDPQIAPHHAILRREGADLTVVALSQEYPVLVNGVNVQSHRLRDGEVLQFGTSLIRYRSRESAVPSSSQVYGAA